MSRRYSPKEREEALFVLQVNGSNIPLTSTQTGIPERTLRAWRREHLQEQLLPPLPPQPGGVVAAANPPPEFSETADALKYVRDQIAQETIGMAHTLHETLTHASPYHRVLAFTLLLDRMDKLEALIAKNSPAPTIRFEFVDSDGSTHVTPYWERMNREQERQSGKQNITPLHNDHEEG